MLLLFTHVILNPPWWYGLHYIYFKFSVIKVLSTLMKQCLYVTLCVIRVPFNLQKHDINGKQFKWNTLIGAPWGGKQAMQNSMPKVENVPSTPSPGSMMAVSSNWTFLYLVTKPRWGTKTTRLGLGARSCFGWKIRVSGATNTAWVSLLPAFTHHRHCWKLSRGPFKKKQNIQPFHTYSCWNTASTLRPVALQAFSPVAPTASVTSTSWS